MTGFRFTPLALVVSALVASLGCASAHRSNSALVSVPGKIITEEMITSYHVSNAYEVLRKTGQYLTSRDDGPNGGTSIRSRRGKTSLLMVYSDVPRIIVDGTRLTDYRILRDIPAASIAWIQLLNGMDGTLYEGTNSGAGVIIIVTKAGT